MYAFHNKRSQTLFIDQLALSKTTCPLKWPHMLEPFSKGKNKDFAKIEIWGHCYFNFYETGCFGW